MPWGRGQRGRREHIRKVPVRMTKNPIVSDEVITLPERIVVGQSKPHNVCLDNAKKQSYFLRLFRRRRGI